MDRLRIGYVGAGYLAQRVHLPNILGLPELELAAIAEVRPKLGEQVRAAFGIPKLYADHMALAADASIRAVCVSGHFAGQGEIARDLLLAGKDVFMEKPMAVSVEQAERILAAEKSSGKRLMVGYMKRYDAGNILVKTLIDGYRASGELGPVTYVRQHGFCGDWIGGLDTPVRTTDEPMPAAPKVKPGWMPDAIVDRYISYLQQYTHNVNLVRWFLEAGDRVKVTHVDLDAKGMSGVVTLDVNGTRAIIESGWLDYHAWDEHTQVYFTKGWVRTEAPPLLMRNQPASVEVYRKMASGGWATERHLPKDTWTWSYKEELRHFATCVMTGAPFRSPASDALADVRTLEEIYRAFVAQNG